MVFMVLSSRVDHFFRRPAVGKPLPGKYSIWGPFCNRELPPPLDFFADVSSDFGNLPNRGFFSPRFIPGPRVWRTGFSPHYFFFGLRVFGAYFVGLAGVEYFSPPCEPVFLRGLRYVLLDFAPDRTVVFSPRAIVAPA
jgi:hypothetical protein